MHNNKKKTTFTGGGEKMHTKKDPDKPLIKADDSC